MKRKNWMILGVVFLVAVAVYYLFYQTKPDELKASAAIYFFPGGALPTQDAGNLILDDRRLPAQAGGSNDPRDGGWIQ